jgi:hypothetical protein
LDESGLRGFDREAKQERFSRLRSLLAIIWLIATQYPRAQPVTIDAAHFWLLTYPLAFFGLDMFGTEKFWAKYQIYFFPVCFPIFYMLGCSVGWVFGFGKIEKLPNRW